MKRYEFRFNVTFDAPDDIEARFRGVALRRLVSPAAFTFSLCRPVVAVFLREIYPDHRGVSLPDEA